MEVGSKTETHATPSNPLTDSVNAGDKVVVKKHVPAPNFDA